jgi:hypothetical protein
MIRMRWLMLKTISAPTGMTGRATDREFSTFAWINSVSTEPDPCGSTAVRRKLVHQPVDHAWKNSQNLIEAS